MDKDTTELITMMLRQLIQQQRFSEEGFVEKVRLVGEHLESEKSKKQVDISLSQLYSFIEDSYKQLHVREENKALTVPLRQPKVHRLYVDGVFDLTHSGHFNAIRQAKQLCEVLVLGVVSTEEVIKRKGPPVLTYEERAGIARACKWVDEVYDNAPYDPTLELLDKLNCSHVAHGDDLILLPDGTDSYQPFRNVNRFLTFKRTEGISTTDIVGRLLLLTKQEHNPVMKNIRKMSGDGDHLIASRINQLTDDGKYSTEQNKSNQEEVQQSYNNSIEISEKTANKVKLLNTTKRIRQFSHGLKEPKAGQKIVYIDGSYDMIHIGHISTLQIAKQQGDYLIVGLHDDDVITEKKGRHYPLLSLQERVLSVLAMKYVDEVIIGAPWKVTKAMMDQFKIDLVVSGSIDKLEYPIQDQEDDPYEVPKSLGKFQTIKSTYDLTTDKIIERILLNRKNFLDIYNIKNQKQNIYLKQKEQTGDTISEI